VTILEIVAIAVGLAMDAFAVAVAGGAGGRLRHPRPAIRLAFHLGLFQAMMPVVGWYLGASAVALVGGVGRWIAFALLAVVGFRMVAAGARGGTSDAAPGPDPSRGWTLVGVSVATSLDALAVGVSLAMLGVEIWQPSAIIGLVTAAIALVGVAIGDRLGRGWGGRVEIAGGALLVIIGLRILVAVP
jgi:putative Mn2+ efflux pump MntP